MTPEQIRAHARKGGLKASALGKTRRFTHDEAVAAGALGGKKVSQDREYMREIGRRGGQARKKAVP